MTDASPSPTIDAVPLKHPWRWVAAGVIIVLLGLFLWGAATNDAYGWETYAKYLFDQRISEAAWNTLQLTIYSMVLALVLGVLLAVMRLSPNPVLKAVSWTYLWIFRGTPIYVQLVLWGLVPVIYKNIQLGVPFGPTLFEFSLSDPNVFLLAVLGLGLNEAAYMAEIIRAGINSVPEGQTEASVALGMSWGLTMRRTVLPQAMRVIIPPTGNQFIAMLKDSSLVSVVGVWEIMYLARTQGQTEFRHIEMLITASMIYWILSIGLEYAQARIEERFGRFNVR